MKKLFSPIISGMAGGLIVLAGLLYIQKVDKARAGEVTHLTSDLQEATFANVPDDFIVASELARPAVVHISASESTGNVQQKSRGSFSRRDPFSFFFGDDLFGGHAPREGKGSGVIISDNGHIVTNNHVIEFADQFEVTLYDDRKYKAVLIGSDPRTDLAVLKIEAEGLPFLRFGNSEEVAVGEWVLAVGNPFDLTSTVTAGIVSAKGRHKILKRMDAIEDFIQTDAVVNPGNSGGALVAKDGQLIGINTAIATATGYYAGYSFAIPAEIVQPVVENIIEFGGPRVTLGVNVATIEDYETYAEIDLKVEDGVVVTKVEDGSVAQYAGIVPQDVIISIDKERIYDVNTLVELMNKHRIGDEILLVVRRNGKRKDILVKLKD
ncbi:MAG: PDZ domain-containing protein [Saprospiraceae bacterium]|nr:PDZ domain-containing protein [Saprospiraceae bacterium]